ncbi:peptide/nickel transport system permease protein [Ensifer sp. 4252]
MHTILAKKLALLSFTLFVSSVLIFVAAEGLPVDVGRDMLGRFAPQEAVDALNEKLGMNKPLLERYGHWVGGAVTGDLGFSTSQQQPVGPLILRHAANSAILAAVALAVITPMAFLLGMFAGLYPGSRLDRLISTGSLATNSTPEFVVGVLVLLLFAVHLRVLPGSSAMTGGATPLSDPSRLVLPVMTLAIVDVGYLARMMRVSMIEVMGSSYIRAAVLRGLPFRRIVVRHALRSALVTPITVLMLHINWLIGGIVVTEAIFGYPGLGLLMLTAANQKDVPLLEGGALVFAIVAVCSQVAADFLNAWLNPRIGAGLA